MLSGTPPAGPTALKVAQSSATALTLRWKDNANNESGFKILRSSDGTVFKQINAIAANLTTYVNGKLKTGTHYWYRVIAFNAAGDSKRSNTAEGTPTFRGWGDGCAAEGTNSTCTLTLDGDKQVTADWVDNS